MAVFVAGAWTKSVVNSMNIWECDIVGPTAADSADEYTKVIDFLNPYKPWVLVCNAAGAAVDGTTCPVDIWGGWSTVGLTGDTTAVAWDSGDGGRLQAGAVSDIQAAANTVLCDPNFTGAAVAGSATVGGHVNIAPMPYYVVHVNGGSTLSSTTCHFVVIQ